MRADHLYRAAKRLNKSLNSFFGEPDTIDPILALDIVAKALKNPEPVTSSRVPSDILRALEGADEVDLRSVRNILDLPIPNSKDQAN
jgi:hypothetical protein